jgi:hypothetical protein
MSFAEGDRVRVVAPESAAGGYANGDIGVVEDVVKSGLRVRWDDGQASMVFEREVELVADDETMPEVDEPTAWDHYAAAALQGLIAGREARHDRQIQADLFNSCRMAADCADMMMGLRRGRA